VKRFFQKSLISKVFSLFLNLVKNLSISPARPGPPVGPGPPVSAGLPGRARPGGPVNPTWSLSPRSPLPPLSPEPWRLRRPAATALDSDELCRSPPPRWVAIDRSRNGARACPRDLIDYPLVLSSLSPPALWISAMATSSLISSRLAFSSARPGAGGCGVLPT
jgi:hypothetical protein